MRIRCGINGIHHQRFMANINEGIQKCDKQKRNNGASWFRVFIVVQLYNIPKQKLPRALRDGSAVPLIRNR